MRDLRCVGALTVEDGMPVFVVDDSGRRKSVLSYDEKLDHFREVQQTAAEQAHQRDMIAERLAPFREWDPRVQPGPIA